MIVITEGDLQIEFPLGTNTRKFDNGKEHGLSHCMKAVDFIIEFSDRIWFLELKDPDSYNGSTDSKKAFMNKLTSRELDSDLKYKYRDSYLYELASGHIKDKPIYYYVLLGLEQLSPAELLARTDALKRNLPIKAGNGKPWKKPFISGCAVMNLATWNNSLTAYPASRLSKSA